MQILCHAYFITKIRQVSPADCIYSGVYIYILHLYMHNLALFDPTGDDNRIWQVMKNKRDNSINYIVAKTRGFGSSPYAKLIFKMSLGSCRDAQLSTQRICCSSQGTGVQFPVPTTWGGLQPPIIPTPRHLTPSSDLLGNPHTCGIYTDRTNTQKSNSILKKRWI